VGYLAPGAPGAVRRWRGAVLDPQRPAGARSAMFELEGVINQQLLSVRTQFYTVLFAKQRIAVQEENVNLLAQQLKDARSRFDAGTTSNFDVLRAEVALANGQPPLIQARNDFRVAVEQLRQLVGYVAPKARIRPRSRNWSARWTSVSR